MCVRTSLVYYRDKRKELLKLFLVRNTFNKFSWGGHPDPHPPRLSLTSWLWHWLTPRLKAAPVGNATLFDFEQFNAGNDVEKIMTCSGRHCCWRWRLLNSAWNAVEKDRAVLWRHLVLFMTVTARSVYVRLEQLLLSSSRSGYEQNSFHKLVLVN